MIKSKTKRLRIFAGPNGSGKSTLAENLPKQNISLGIFVNADEIEKELNNKGSLSLYKYYRFKSTTKELRDYILNFGMTPVILKNKNSELDFKIIKNRIYYTKQYNSYIAADIASFIRSMLLKRGKSFSFETVFSHKSKLEIMREAKRLGYRVYFYFLATDDPEININRVDIRVDKSGHPVPKEKIIKRYYKSLELMYDAVKLSTRAYLFDNSGTFYELVAQIDFGKRVEILDYDKKIPNWFIRYLYEKSLKK